MSYLPLHPRICYGAAFLLEGRSVAVVKTPCIGVCSTGIGDSVCRGCKRFAHEVINWNSYTEEERRVVMKRLDTLLSPLIQSRIVIKNEGLLIEQLTAQKVKMMPQLSIWSSVYEAIRSFGSQLKSLESIGCEMTYDWKDSTIAELKTALEEEFYQLSCVHYERYFPGHL